MFNDLNTIFKSFIYYLFIYTVSHVIKCCMGFRYSRYCVFSYERYLQKLSYDQGLIQKAVVWDVVWDIVWDVVWDVGIVWDVYIDISFI